MSWSIRDYKTTQSERAEGLPPPAILDDDPLPTYAAGLEDYDDEAPGTISLSQRQELRRQGYLTEAQLDRWAHIMRRGVVEL